MRPSPIAASAATGDAKRRTGKAALRKIDAVALGRGAGRDAKLNRLVRAEPRRPEHQLELFK